MQKQEKEEKKETKENVFFYVRSISFLYFLIKNHWAKLNRRSIIINIVYIFIILLWEKNFKSELHN